jgi:16S rRNA (guanine966-N2)-methyltransferase
MLKIIAGEYRSRRLLSPEDDALSRPYGARVKESVFNLLRGWFEGAHVLDLFAGVGTMGLEAVSRGATKAVLVERDRDIFELLKRNIETLGCDDRAQAVHADALSPAALDRAPMPVNLVFVDPPYSLMEEQKGRQRVLAQIERCRPRMADQGFVVLRSPVPADAEFTISGFDGPEEHRYGKDMNVLLYAPKGTH